MTPDQLLILAVLAATFAAFIWSPWRHDLVALAALITCTFVGVVPAEGAFAGFGHPAVVTVAAVLVLSSGLQNTGVVDVLARKVLPSSAGRFRSLTVLLVLGAFLSAFMNNVGAMALLMPVAVGLARRLSMAPGQVLMPLAFGTILGGMTTLIGTPPNLIVASFREAGGGFGMFDYSPVGVAVASSGLALVLLGGWRLVPRREVSDGKSFETGKYFTEARVTEESKVNGRSIGAAEALLDEADAQIVGMVRNDFRVSAPNPHRVLRRGDVLVIEADPDELAAVISTLGLRMEAAVEAEEEEHREEREREARERAAEEEPGTESPAASEEKSDEKDDRAEVDLREFVVLPNSALVGRSANDIQLRPRYGLSLLALSREGHRSIRRLRATSIRAGDVLLLQGVAESLAGFSNDYRCIPLAARDLRVPDKGAVTLAVVVMVMAIALSAFGVLAPAVSFVAAVVVYLARRVVPLRNVYAAIDWPVIVLLGALIPVAHAMSTTGTADLIASGLLRVMLGSSPVVALTLMLVTAMMLSDFMNNAATAAVLAPIALSVAEHLEVNADSFLMAVAIGASCAFLTPIGHQNNTLILGPGGFRFGDYWRLGLPLEVLVVAVSVPMLLWVWPL
jgi:di/tricarboxylate transporter